LHLWQKQLTWEKININERSNLMYIEEDASVINLNERSNLMYIEEDASVKKIQ
jgi:hypothetical protein